MWFANFNMEVCYLWRYLHCRNPQIKLYLFEDGFATYSDFYGNTFLKLLYPTDAIHRWTRKRTFDAFYHIDALYCFHPEQITWNTDFPAKQVPMLQAMNISFLKQLNLALGYERTTDCYDYKYIFFEEAYFADGHDIDDVLVVEHLAKIVGKDNIFVKIHPRNPENRFAKLGYTTNHDTAIPWEIIALNLDLREKVLLTIASVSVITPYYLFGLDYHAALLYPCIEHKEHLRQDILPTYEKICALNPTKLEIVHDIEAFCLKLLREQKEGCSNE